jgi:hypothetical protein
MHQVNIHEAKTQLSKLRDLANTNLPFIMSPNLNPGGIEHEDIDCGSECGIPTICGFDSSFGWYDSLA